MGSNILPNTGLLATFDACIKTGATEAEAADFTASEHDVSEETVMGAVYARESRQAAQECMG